MNLRFAHVQKSLSSAPVQSCCPQRALFQVYISYSMQKGQASSCKMYTRGEIFIEICRFLVKLQAFCRILTKPEASAIFFTDSGRKPDAQAEACFFHLTTYSPRLSIPVDKTAFGHRKENGTWTSYRPLAAHPAPVTDHSQASVS